MASGDLEPAEGEVAGERLKELARKDFPQLDTSHWLGAAEVAPNEKLRAAASGGSLPYDSLNEYAFERLCFHLLLAKGEQPRFWGRRGQAQHGIDLILSDGRASTVYQCKHTQSFSASDLETAVHKFRDEWLTRPELGRPGSFVLCTSARLDDTATWEGCKQRLTTKIGVGIEEWHRATLDGWLRDQPGIVADLFGDQIAKIFCGESRRWDRGLFQAVATGCGEKRVDHYLDLVVKERIVRHHADAEHFRRILGRGRVVLLGGLAGTGKTMAALDLASAFEDGAWRVFYLRADDIDDVGQVVNGIEDRAFRPSVFVLDDCHLAFIPVERLVRRIKVIGDAHIKLVLTARVPPEGMDFLDPIGTAFVNELRENEEAISVQADETRFRAIVENRKPEWVSPPIHKLMAWTGRDLTILDLVLDAITPADFEDITKLEDLFPKILSHVFGAIAADARNLKQLAAVAQFDVEIPRNVFSEPLEANRTEQAAAERFIVVAGRPPALRFYHPSAAELIWRLLAWAQGEAELIDACARDCAVVLAQCMERHGADLVLNQFLPRLLRTRLKLSDDGAIKRALLSDPSVVALIKDPGARVHAVALSLATFLCRDLQQPPPYAAWLAERLEGVANNPAAAEGIGLIAAFLRTLALADANAHRSLELRIGSNRIVNLIMTRGTLVELLGILQYGTPAFAAELLRAFDREQVQALVEATIKEEKSIGTLDLAMRDLGERRLADEPGRTQLHLFEERLGGAAMAKLIAARGTLVELLRILARSTPAFAAELLRAFDQDQVQALVEATIKEEESISGVAPAMRMLGRRKVPGAEGITQLHMSEELLGIGGVWRLVQKTGDLGDFADIANALNPTFRDMVVAPEQAPDRAGWIALAQRGTFYGLAKFACHGLPLLPDRTADGFRGAVEVTAANLASSSTWGEVGAGLAKTEKTADERVRKALVAATQQRIADVDVATLDFDNYQEATEGLSVLWYRRPELRPQLGAQLWCLLPNEQDWPLTYELLRMARFILAIARSEHVSKGDALRVLKAFAPLGLDVEIDPKSARFHALFLWNLFALWFERGRDVAPEFRALQDNQTWDRLVGVVEKRQKWGANEQKLDTLQLAGALAYLVPDLCQQLVELVRSKIVGISYLAKKADDDLSFVPAFLAFHGMALSAPEGQIFSPERVSLLLEKVKAYEEQGPALDHARRSLPSSAR